MTQKLQTQVTRIQSNDAPIHHWSDPVRGRLSWRTLLSSDWTPTCSLVFGLAYFDAGDEERLHHHAHPQLVHVTEGNGRVVVDGEEYSLQPGDTLFIPGHALHSFHATECGMILIFLFGADSINEIEYFFSDENKVPFARQDPYQEPMLGRRGTNMSSSPTCVSIDDVPLEHWNDLMHGYVSWRTLISADRSSSDSVVCGIAYFDTGGELKSHHHAPDEVFHVLTGAGTAIIEGVEYPMEAGDTLFVPGYTFHSFRANDGGMEMLYFFGVDSFSEIEYIFEHQG